jgi:hypothetical protein
MSQGHLLRSRIGFGTSVGISRRLVANAPENAEWQRGLLVSLAKLAAAGAYAGDFTAARGIANDALAQAHFLTQRFPERPLFQEDLRAIEQLLHRIDAALSSRQ